MDRDGPWRLGAAHRTGRRCVVDDPWSVSNQRLRTRWDPTAQPNSGPTEFVTTGPYGWVRHPIYSAWILMTFAEPVMTATRLSFAAISTLYLVLAIPFEERSLHSSEGSAFSDYTRVVRWKLVPWIY